MPNKDSATLEILFRRATNLPALPTSVIRLVEAIDSGEASARDLERIIVSDPALACAFLRLAGRFGLLSSANQTTIGHAIVIMGQRAVRSLALSLAVKSFVGDRDQGSPLDQKCFARHSLAVGYIARYLTSRQTKLNPFWTPTWSPEEMFAAGVLHDMGAALLAKMSPQAYQRAAFMAQRTGTSIEDAFEKIFERSLTSLGSIAAECWNLPDVFVKTQRYLSAPWEAGDQYTQICHLVCADRYAHQLGYAESDWPYDAGAPAEVLLEGQLAEEELNLLAEALEPLVDAYFEATAA